MVPAVAVRSEAAGATVNEAVLLRLDNVEVTYHRVATAVQGVSLDVREGTIVALLGTNGAGKTTTLRAISGFIGLDDARVTDGSIAHRASGSTTVRRTRSRRAASRSSPSGARCSRTSRWPRTWRPSCLGAAPMRAGWPTLCGSTFRRSRSCALATPGCCPEASGRCLRSAPRWPAHRVCCWWTSFRKGWRRLIVQELIGLLQVIRRDLGMTVLLVEQNAAVALDVADHAYVLENGRIVLAGTPDELRKHPDIREFYLGFGGERQRSYRDVKQYRRRRRWYG